MSDGITDAFRSQDIAKECQKIFTLEAETITGLYKESYLIKQLEEKKDVCRRGQDYRGYWGEHLPTIVEGRIEKWKLIKKSKSLEGKLSVWLHSLKSPEQGITKILELMLKDYRKISYAYDRLNRVNLDNEYGFRMVANALAKLINKEKSKELPYSKKVGKD